MPARRKFQIATPKGFCFSALQCAIFLSFFFFVLASPIFAAMSLTFSDAPSTITEEEPFDINVSLIDAPASRSYYLRAAFYEEGKTQYFGYTYNHEGSWHNVPGEHQKFLRINTSQEGSWSGKLKAKVDLEATAFKGAGNYSFKIGRYTEGGSGPTWSDNTTTITISVQPTPTPTPTPSPTPSPSPSPTPTPSPTSTPTSSPLLSPTPKTSVKKLIPSPSPGLVLGEEEESTISFYPWEATQEAEKSKEATPSKRKIFPLVLLGLGLTFLAAAACWLWYTQIK